MTVYIYTDAQEKPSTIKDAMGNITDRVYENGNLIRETLPDGTEYAYAYDAINRLTHKMRIVLDDGGFSRFILLNTYNYKRNTTTGGFCVTEERFFDECEYGTTGLGAEGKSCTTIKEYDHENRLIKQTSPDGGVTINIYNKDGTLSRTTDPIGGEKQYKYNTLKLPIEDLRIRFYGQGNIGTQRRSCKSI